MQFKHLFSRRKEIEDENKQNKDGNNYFSYELNSKVKHKLVGTILDHHFKKLGHQFAGVSPYDEFDEVDNKLERALGKRISNKHYPQDKIVDFLCNCSKDEFFDSLEILLNLKNENIEKLPYDASTIKSNLSSFIKKINEIFQIDKIGYEIVPSGNSEQPIMIVKRDSQYLYDETIKKPMILMYDANFKGALNEFEKALDELRKGEYEDTIHKATKSYESTLKTILDLKNINYDKAKDNKIPTLVEKIRNDGDIIDGPLKTVFDSFWGVLQNGPSNIRNMPGVAHGQGQEINEMKKSYANFVLRLTGTYIVFLIERYNETR